MTHLSVPALGVQRDQNGVLTAGQRVQASPAGGGERESPGPVVGASWISHAAWAADHRHCPGHGSPGTGEGVSVRRTWGSHTCSETFFSKLFSYPADVPQSQ